MHAQRVAPYGTWPSLVTADLVAGQTVGLSELAVDEDSVFWLESRPAERGRRALVRWSGTEPADVLPLDANVGSHVHEYGGGGYAVREGRIVFSERSDGSVRLAQAGDIRTVAAVEGCRYAAFAFDPAADRVFAVREDHRERPPTAPLNEIVVLDLAAGIDPAHHAGRVVVSGSDFVLAPQLSPDGTEMAWIAWDQPAMPWEETRLWVARVAADGTVHDARCVAGTAGRESIVEAHWSPGGTLIFASDRTNWWNLYALRDGTAEPLAPVDAEIGAPPWVFGRTCFTVVDENRILCSYVRDGVVRAGLVSGGVLHDLGLGPIDTTPLPYAGGVVFLAAPPDAPPAVCRAPQFGGAGISVIRPSGAIVLRPGDTSIGESETAATDDGESAHFFFYPPRNADAAGPPGAHPPLIVMSHGGPTSMHTNAFSYGIQWWTSRGFAVAHVNYRGSSGFGRAYRERLAGAWGVIDVIDCISVARRLAEQGRCDPARIAIRGGSASGMTALLAVATSDVFAAAASLYGVMELEMLAADTHKFEARYTDGLIGPLPEARERYRARSPLTHVKTINVPVILFQGLDDHVVPPNQAIAMRDALAARGVRVVHEAFAGEGHGFRKAETIRRVFEDELAFYRDVFGLTD